jgi:formamidopyrimidine-DNA glycosylase
MPELPEIEILSQHLAPAIIGETFQKVHSFRPDLRIPLPSNLAAIVENQTIRAVGRRAKYLLITLSNDHTLVIHLGMSGILQLNHAADALPLTQIPKHDHVWFMLENGMQLRYHDPRRFGLYLARSSTPPPLRQTRTRATDPSL